MRQKWAGKKLVQCNRGWCKVLYQGRNNSMLQFKLAFVWEESSFVMMGPLWWTESWMWASSVPLLLRRVNVIPGCIRQWLVSTEKMWLPFFSVGEPWPGVLGTVQDLLIQVTWTYLWESREESRCWCFLKWIKYIGCPYFWLDPTYLYNLENALVWTPTNFQQ